MAAPLPDHRSAMKLLDEWMGRAWGPEFHKEVHSVGHRVVHGGRLAEACIVRWGRPR